MKVGLPNKNKAEYPFHTHIHTHTHIDTQITANVCVCVCVCECMEGGGVIINIDRKAYMHIFKGLAGLLGHTKVDFQQGNCLFLPPPPGQCLKTT